MANFDGMTTREWWAKMVYRMNDAEWKGLAIEMKAEAKKTDEKRDEENASR